MTELNHEPETKSTNKARDFQDVIIRARRAGHSDPLAVANYAYDWFMDAPHDVQISVLQYAITHLWNVVDAKIAPERKPTTTRQRQPLSPEAKARIEANMRMSLDRKWLDAIIPMTGAQVRAAKTLPDRMASKVGDDQRVGDVFTVDELRKVYKKAQK